MLTEVVTTYLEMRSPEAVHPSATTDLVIVEAQIPCPEFSRFLYTAVGGSWYWVERLSWSYRTWVEHLTQKAIRTWVGYQQGTPAGYYELSKQPDGSVKIDYFGLLPQFIGQGYGGHLLTHALQSAWAWKANRVWVHTCTLDGEHALKNYQARGLVIFKQVKTFEDLPTTAPGAWPGANQGHSQGI